MGGGGVAGPRAQPHNAAHYPAGIPAGRFVLHGGPARAIRPGPWPGGQARMRPQEALSRFQGWALPAGPASPFRGTLHPTGATAPPGHPRPGATWKLGPVQPDRRVNSSWGASLRPPQFPEAAPTAYHQSQLISTGQFPQPPPSLPLLLPPPHCNLPWGHSLAGSQWKLQT